MRKSEDRKMLLIGIGNSGREDDGLGWAFLEKVEQEAFFKGDRLFKFQLNLEDAELLSNYHRVIFVDAHRGVLPGGFSLTHCKPEAGAGFSTHLLLPETTLYLCQQLYQKQPQAWVLAIQGYQWEMKEELSLAGRQNLEKAFAFFRNYAEQLNASAL